MLTRDVWLCFKGWNDHHGKPEPGANAPSRAEYNELVRRVDGGNSRDT